MVIWNKQLKPRMNRKIRRLPNSTAKVQALSEIWGVLNSDKVKIIH